MPTFQFSNQLQSATSLAQLETENTAVTENPLAFPAVHLLQAVGLEKVIFVSHAGKDKCRRLPRIAMATAHPGAAFVVIHI